jgi:hypothetical protein
MDQRAKSGHPDSILLLDCDPGRFRYSLWRNITVGVWADQATTEAAQRVLELSRSLAKAHENGHSNVLFVLNNVAPPTPEANQIFTQMHDYKVSGLACLAIVIEGSGFWASAMRSTITGARIARPGSMRLGVADDIEQVLEWLPAEHSARTGVKVTEAELRSVLLTLRDEAANDNGVRPLMAVGSRSNRP